MVGTTPARRGVDRRRSTQVGFLIGVAVMAAVDTIVFHQLLGWHHLYDRATPDVGLMSDGLLQASYLVLLVGGLFLFGGLRRAGAVARGSAWGGFLVGTGAFQVFDGVVNHKVLRLHQIRYGVGDLLLYDLAWNGVGLVLLGVGALVIWRTRDQGSTASTSRTSST